MKQTSTFVLAFTLIAAAAVSEKARAQLLVPRGNVAEGKSLFLRNWQIGDALAARGDGLGPMHNAASCVACHKQGGTGGGGPLNNNVDILSPTPSSGRQNILLGRIHPAFKVTAGGSTPTNIVVHRFATNAAYGAAREMLLQRQEESISEEDRTPTSVSRAPIRRLAYPNSITLVHSQRNTPALFGAGLIDQIPAVALHQAARRQEKMGGVVRGQVPRVGKQVGRFGWRGQTAHLHDFVLMACANELGLSNRRHAQAIRPDNPSYRPRGVDLTEAQCRSITAFVSSLPVPQPVEPSAETAKQEIKRGYVLFGKMGCATCHQKDMAHVRGLYSDMLLHDMGQELSDSIAEYYNSSSSSINPRLWRTPPLWGARLSAPYMHDGRAATLMEAILLHAGEGNFSRNLFLQAPLEQRLAVIAFLKSL